MTLNKTLELTRKLLKQHGLKDWKVSTNKRIGCFAICNYEHKTISFSSILTPYCKPKFILDTILHELAHALTEGHAHDNIWKKKFIKLGGSGLIYGDDEHYIDGGKFLYKICKYYVYCKHCDEKIPYFRKPRKTFRCGSCHKKMKLIENERRLR